MKYQTKAVPLLTVADVDAAKAAGARIEYTACGRSSEQWDHVPDTYDMPLGGGGWIVPYHDVRNDLGQHDIGDLVRAFYPEADA